MNTYVLETALIAAAYAVGCLSTGYYLVRLRIGVDVRRTGSGNIGARNVGRALGKGGLAVTLIGDAVKGAIPVAAALFLEMEQWVVMAVLFAVVTGHIFPVQLGLQGGKGLATTMGGMLVLDFRLVIAAFAIAGIAWLISRNLTGSGLVAVALTPVLALIAGHTPFTFAALVILSIALIFTHRANLRTMLAGMRKTSDEGRLRPVNGGERNEK